MTSEPKLPPKLAAHPSVQTVLARRRTGHVASPPAVIDAGWLHQLCLAAGADDAAAVSLDHADLAGEREHALAALPGTRSLIAMMFRMNRDNCQSPVRSVANREYHQTDEQANHAARSVTQALQDAGYRALNPSAGFPQEMDLARFAGPCRQVAVLRATGVAALSLAASVTAAVFEPPPSQPFPLQPMSQPLPLQPPTGGVTGGGVDTPRCVHHRSPYAYRLCTGP